MDINRNMWPTKSNFYILKKLIFCAKNNGTKILVMLPMMLALKITFEQKIGKKKIIIIILNILLLFKLYITWNQGQIRETMYPVRATQQGRERKESNGQTKSKVRHRPLISLHVAQIHQIALVERETRRYIANKRTPRVKKLNVQQTIQLDRTKHRLV